MLLHISSWCFVNDLQLCSAISYHSLHGWSTGEAARRKCARCREDGNYEDDEELHFKDSICYFLCTEGCWRVRCSKPEILRIQIGIWSLTASRVWLGNLWVQTVTRKKRSKFFVLQREQDPRTEGMYGCTAWGTRILPLGTNPNQQPESFYRLLLQIFKF